MNIDDLVTRLINTESRLAHLELKVNSMINERLTDHDDPDSVKFMIKDEATIINIIKVQMTSDIKAEVIRDPLLKAVHEACFKESSKISEESMSALRKFESAWTNKGKKFSKNELCSKEYKEKNLVRRTLNDIIRMAWSKYHIFNNDNPLNDLMTTGIQTSEKLKEILKMISIQFVYTVFNSKEILNQVSLPPFTRNYIYTILYIIYYYKYYIDIYKIIEEQMKNRVKRLNLKNKSCNQSFDYNGETNDHDIDLHAE
jgi:hypothetical protein